MSGAVDIPGSPHSIHSSLSGLSGSPPALDAGTLSILDQFLSAKAEEETLFNSLSEQAAALEVAGLALDDEKEEKPMISVEEYRKAFGEDWQLSQFWYSTQFATTLAESIHSLCEPNSTIAFLCCPTAFVAFQHEYSYKNAYLLEFDQRFSVLAPKLYIPYDLDEPDVFPDSLREKVDLAIVDPPFLNEITNKKLTQTLRQILHPARGKLLIITSTSAEPILEKVYTEAPLGPLRKTALDVEHGQLANDFASYGSWKGAEKFGMEEA
ncbi:Protein-lysine N-methyltransferase efm5 [Stygiomarasmius scandens]|uniref:Protein-lysine N-methyltransferase efm5 n=1 Tax=Marasmiellus scandens TaxID=2682957 RepID=A0ABR1JXS9_9AGAR